MAGWAIFSIIIVAVLALDLFVFHKKPHAITFKEATLWSVVWISLALFFNIYIYFAMGKEAALNFLTGYLIEKSLSLDNLFIFLLIFKYFQTPASSLHKVLFWGILGAIITRALFILLGLTLVEYFHPVIYIFGVILVVSGIKLGLEKEKEIQPKNNFIVKLFSRFFPIAKEYEGDRFFIRKGSRLFLTPLFLVLLTIESTDIIFAIDSIPAILAITYDPFIVFTSNIFAILGLRALYFLLAGSLQHFRFLHYGISIILVFVGVKMLISDLWKMPASIALGFVFATLLASILASILIPTKEE